MDFTLNTYQRLLQTLLAQNIIFQPITAFMQTPAKQAIILRHDVDRLPGSALRTARMENYLGIKASYYFRAMPESWDEKIILQIADLGHEIGYHYEDLSLCKGDYDSAIKQFEKNLKIFRKIYPVQAICMHGSPLSKYDNRSLWNNYDYRDYGIIGEPYFDLDFNKVFYITDTGRRWNNEGSSVRDKVETKFNIQIKNTSHLIELIEQNKLPDQLMINTHPQRWFDFGPMWVKELVWQNTKNVIKKYFFVKI